VLDVKSKDEIHLRVRHEKGQAPVELSFAPSETRMLDATKSSVHVVTVDGKKLGIIHLWHFMSSDMNDVLMNAIERRFADCDGLVLDVRGRGGRVNVIYEVTDNFTGKHPLWNKPIVVLQDHGTRSAKEIFAWSWKKKHLGKIVGERTLGAVIGCMFKKLWDGSVLMYPAQDVRPMTKGEPLEGHGVEPDVAVDPGDLRFRDGRDPILEKGERVLLEEIATYHPAGRWL
jgi:C-terminal processing protease CtpA/Prc